MAWNTALACSTTLATVEFDASNVLGDEVSTKPCTILLSLLRELSYDNLFHKAVTCEFQLPETHINL